METQEINLDLLYIKTIEVLQNYDKYHTIIIQYQYYEDETKQLVLTISDNEKYERLIDFMMKEYEKQPIKKEE